MDVLARNAMHDHVGGLINRGTPIGGGRPC
jgi:hypothetical protein